MVKRGSKWGRGIRIGQAALHGGFSFCLTLVAGLSGVAMSSSAHASRVNVETPDDAAFFVESIRVDGLERASERILLAEARLEAGRRYAESALRDAAFRVNRLSFVLDARFVLERGSRRGAYVLVIQVRETERFFFGLSAEALVFGEGVVFGSESARPPRLTDSESGFSGTIGIRHFVGARGVAFAALGDQSFEVGYTQHDLFDRGAFVAVSLAHRDYDERVFPLGLDPTFATWSFDGAFRMRIDAGLPMGGSRALRFGVELLAGDAGVRNELLGPAFPSTFETVDARHIRVDARWAFDTTDDPTVPTRGRSVQAGVAVRALENEQTLVEFNLGSEQRTRLPDHQARMVEAFASGVHHWPISQRQTVTVGLVGRLGRSRVEGLVTRASAALEAQSLTTVEIAASARYAVALGTPQRPAGRGEMRLELEAAYAYEATSPSLDLAGNPVEKRQIGIAFVHRSAWGLLRFGLTYLDFGDGVR